MVKGEISVDGTSTSRYITKVVIRTYKQTTRNKHTKKLNLVKKEILNEVE